MFLLREWLEVRNYIAELIDYWAVASVDSYGFVGAFNSQGTPFILATVSVTHVRYLLQVGQR